MEDAHAPSGLTTREKAAAMVGLLLSGFAIAVTAVSYVANSPFPYRWLVWALGVFFGAVALVALMWPTALSHVGTEPGGRLRLFLLVSMPVAYLLSSQVCGVGLLACSAACHVANLALIGLAAVIAVRIHRGMGVGALLIPLIAIGLVPHCVCAAPVNTAWHAVLGGYAPTCELVPTAATLFAVATVRGVRARLGGAIVAVLLGVIVFMVVGNSVFGFPWEGCVE